MAVNDNPHSPRRSLLKHLLLAGTVVYLGALILIPGGTRGVALAHGAKVTVAPTEALPGAAVTVNGEGFEASKTVTVSLQGALGETTLGTAVADKDENFVLQVTIPASATAGVYTLKAAAGDDQATAQIAVLAPPAPTAQSTTANTPTISGAASTADGSASGVSQAAGRGVGVPVAGDAGLADSSGRSATLYLIAGAVALAFIGVATLRFVRH